MIASQGLTTIEGAGLGGRRPGRSSRVKQSCRLLKCVLRGSDRSRSENSRQHAIDISRISGFSILLNHPMNRVRAARGTRLVNRKFRSSCWVKVAMRLLTVMNLSEGLVSAFVMDSQLSILSLAAGAVAATAVAAPKVKARLALSGANHSSLTGHSKMSRLVARLIPFYEFDINDFFSSDGAPAEMATQRRDGFFRLASLYKERFARSRQMTSEAAGQISDLQFTQAYRGPFQYSRLVREHLGAGSFMPASAGGTLADVGGNVLYGRTRSYAVHVFGQ